MMNDTVDCGTGSVVGRDDEGAGGILEVFGGNGGEAVVFGGYF